MDKDTTMLTAILSIIFMQILFWGGVVGFIIWVIIKFMQHFGVI